MVRPNNPEGARVPFQVRLLAEEKAALDRAAKAAGLSTSTWMRVVCLHEAGASAAPAEPKLAPVA